MVTAPKKGQNKRVRTGRPSLTSMAVAAIRAFYTELPEPMSVAKDPHAKQLLPLPFRVPSSIARHTSARSRRAGAALHEGISALTLGLTTHVALRTSAIDDAIREGIRSGATQIVTLGAGLDGRAYRMRDLNEITLFEVDHPSTQQHKHARAHALCLVPSVKELKRVPVDFERDDLETSLLAAGFSPKMPSFWIWEGVTVYLTRDAIESTLSAIGRISAQGSRVALTYVRPRSEPLERTLLAGGKVAMRVIGEPIVGFLEPDELAALGQKAGLSVFSDEAAEDWIKRYWSQGSAGPFEWERLAVLERQDG